MWAEQKSELNSKLNEDLQLLFADDSYLVFGADDDHLCYGRWSILCFKAVLMLY